MTYTLLYGPELDDLVAGLRRLTGGVPMFPKWAYGYIQSKERYRTQDELVKIVEEYRSRLIPLDGIVLDWHSWTGDLWGQKTFDPERFPDPTQMMANLHRLNARLMISVWPKFSHDGPNQLEMRAAGGLLGDDSTYDAFNPAARALYWQQANNGLFAHGIDAWWCDASEPFEPDWAAGPVKPEPEQRLALNTAVFKKYLDPADLCAYSLLHSQGMYEGQRAVTSEKRVVNLTRSAYPGQQRYGTITWSGDITAQWETLRRQIPAGLNFTVTGNPRWTLDVGGFFVKSHPEQWFWRGDYERGCTDLGYRELVVRWFQYGTFLPMLRTHGTDTPRELWRFGQPGELYFDTLLKFTRLRYRLLPYIYSLAGWESQRAYTMLRSLAFDFRDDPAVYDIADEFMLGPALLVCPVTEPMEFGPNETPDRGASPHPHRLPARRQLVVRFLDRQALLGQPAHDGLRAGGYPAPVRARRLDPAARAAGPARGRTAGRARSKSGCTRARMGILTCTKMKATATAASRASWPGPRWPGMTAPGASAPGRAPAATAACPTAACCAR